MGVKDDYCAFIRYIGAQSVYIYRERGFFSPTAGFASLPALEEGFDPLLFLFIRARVSRTHAGLKVEEGYKRASRIRGRETTPCGVGSDEVPYTVLRGVS